MVWLLGNVKVKLWFYENLMDKINKQFMENHKQDINK